jgi:hypothetical protein
MQNVWIQRIALLSLFILADYLVTLLLAAHPSEEGNTFARDFMTIFGVAGGLTFFSIIVNAPIYLILGFLALYPQRSGFTKLPFAMPSLDIAFAWFVAGTHFSGALSWIASGPSLLYQLTGAVLYLDMLFLVSTKSRRTNAF